MAQRIIFKLYVNIFLLLRLNVSVFQWNYTEYIHTCIYIFLNFQGCMAWYELNTVTVKVDPAFECPKARPFRERSQHLSVYLTLTKGVREKSGTKVVFLLMQTCKSASVFVFLLILWPLFCLNLNNWFLCFPGQLLISRFMHPGVEH